MLFEEALKKQKISFSRSNIFQIVLFWMQSFFQSLLVFKFFISKSETLYILYLKFCCIVKFLEKDFDSLWNFEFVIWRIVDFSYYFHAFRKSRWTAKRQCFHGVLFFLLWSWDIIFFPNSDMFRLFLIVFWHVVKEFFVQNLMPF